MKKLLKNRKGQTTLEYLLLLSAAFISGYIVVTGPMNRAAEYAIVSFKSSITSIVQNGENTPGEVATPGSGNHPGNAKRYKALHL